MEQTLNTLIELKIFLQINKIFDFSIFLLVQVQNWECEIGDCIKFYEGNKKINVWDDFLINIFKIELKYKWSENWNNLILCHYLSNIFNHAFVYISQKFCIVCRQKIIQFSI